MNIICAWCKKKLARDIADAPVSHGMCEECEFHLRAEIGMPIERFLDGIKAPVLLIDADSSVITANRLARALLGKEPPKINGFKGGDVFECEYSWLPGGCGNTSHCSGCTIRRAVMSTMESGKALTGEPVSLRRRGVGDIAFVISTEKAGDRVLLRIDAADGSHA
jgi:PAS domain-containing protein